MKTETKICLAVGLYALIGIIAFGHAINHIKVKTYPSGYTNIPSQQFLSLLSGAFWPFYLSYKLQEDEKAEAEK